MARSLGLSVYTLRSQYNKMKDVEAAVEKCRRLQDNRPKLWGKSYSSITEVAASFGISSHLLYYRIETGASLSEAVLQILQEEPIQFRGKEYSRMVDLCAEFKIQPLTVKERLYRGYSLERALSQQVGTQTGYEITYKGITYSSNIELCRAYGINVICVRDKRKYTSLDFPAIFQVFVDLKKAAHIPLEENLNYIPRCRVRGQNYRSLQDFIEQFGLKYQVVTGMRTKVGGNLFDALKSMQKKTKVVHSIDGQIKKCKEMSYQQMKGADRVMLPFYPKLQGVDFDTDCYDTLEIYRNLVKEAEQQMDESLEEDAGKMNNDMQM